MKIGQYLAKMDKSIVCGFFGPPCTYMRTDSTQTRWLQYFHRRSKCEKNWTPINSKL